ncbi:hypothetical protein RHMOL_Rhmol06G0116900 [Rhododendron molle]|uniref:Uncharacterized protein n=1 Tax=Rhododendron molle TaxID=49168 RepID=A0ACC0NB62_RHOML|nr:hypothetical protein RHMOL_Rhmol06G0116900 [Rhododendron molle]
MAHTPPDFNPECGKEDSVMWLPHPQGFSVNSAWEAIRCKHQYPDELPEARQPHYLPRSLGQPLPKRRHSRRTSVTRERDRLLQQISKYSVNRHGMQYNGILGCNETEIRCIGI